MNIDKALRTIYRGAKQALVILNWCLLHKACCLLNLLIYIYNKWQHKQPVISQWTFFIWQLFSSPTTQPISHQHKAQWWMHSWTQSPTYKYSVVFVLLYVILCCVIIYAMFIIRFGHIITEWMNMKHLPYVSNPIRSFFLILTYEYIWMKLTKVKHSSWLNYGPNDLALGWDTWFVYTNWRTNKWFPVHHCYK